MNAKVNAGSLTCLQDLVFKLLLDLRHDLFDTCRMDSSVHNQLVQCKSCYLASYRVESGEKNSVRCIVHDDFHACGSLQSPDVTTLTSDDTALDFVVLDRECSNCILDGSFSSRSLYSGDYYAFGLLGCIESGIIHGIIDISLCLAARLCLHVLHQQVLSLRGSHARDALDLFVRLLAKRLIFSRFSLQCVFLRHETRLGIVQILHLLLELIVLLVEVVLLLFQPVLRVLDLGVLVVHELLVLALQLEELFLCLQDFLLFQVLSFELGFLQDAVLPALHHYSVNHYVDGDAESGCHQCCCNQNDNVHNS